MSPDDAASADEIPRRVVIATMAGVMAAMFMGALDGTIVGTAMPRVIAELQGFEHYAAVSTVYMLASTVVVPIVGKLSDLYGRKPFLLIGVAIFAVASALCGSATSMTQLVLFRGLQGIGAGFSQAMAFTTIADLFPPARRGRVSGIMGSVFGLSSIIGPAVGGFLTDGPGWRYCFYVNIPIGIAAFAILFFSFPQRTLSKRTTRPEIDWLGALTMVSSVVPIMLALSWGGRDYAWSSPTILGLLGFGVVVFLVFLFVEKRADQKAILPLSLYRNRIIWTSSVSATLISIAMFGSVMFIPLFIQGVIGTSATKSGAVLTPMMFAMIAASMTSGQIMTRTGKYKMLSLAGISLTTVGIGLLALMDVDTTYGVVLRNMIVLGLGLGLTMPVFNLAVQNAVDPRQVGVGTASLQFLRSLGGSVGGAVFGAILSNRFAPAFHAALSPELVQSVPPQMLAQFDNPQMLLNPELQAKLGAIPHAQALLAAVKQALASSLQSVFLVGVCVVGVGIVFAALLRDAPLRKTNRVPP